MNETALVHPGALSCVLPNGFDIPSQSKEALRRRNDDDPMQVAFFGLMSPKKGIENLLHAFKQLPRGRFRLTIHGVEAPGFFGYGEQLKRLVLDLSLQSDVRFCGFVDGEAKEAAFLASDVCVVPSYSENFCNVVGESLAYGVPVIASKGVPWDGLVTHGCGLWVDNSPVSLAAALGSLTYPQLADMGRKGRDWITRDFSWEVIAGQMLEHYENLCR
jgi:glycosyltransferase involved in cell wall biosynthesis